MSPNHYICNVRAAVQKISEDKSRGCCHRGCPAKVEFEGIAVLTAATGEFLSSNLSNLPPCLRHERACSKLRLRLFPIIFAALLLNHFFYLLSVIFYSSCIFFNLLSIFYLLFIFYLQYHLKITSGNHHPPLPPFYRG